MTDFDRVRQGRQMRDIQTTRRELDALAQSDSLETRKDALIALSSALTSEEAHHWAKVNLFSIFSEDSVVDPEGPAGAHRASVVEHVRNVLILLPLLITWLGIALGMHTYGGLTADDPAAAAKPFVQLWQQGFEGRTWVTLTVVAVADFIAILLVIAVSAWLARIRHGIEVTIPARERAVWNQLQGCLTDASIHLARASFDSPARFNESLTAAAQEFERVHKQVGGTVSEVTAMLGRAHEAAVRIEAGVAQLNGSTERQIESAAEVREALGSLVTRLEQADGQARGLISQVESVVEGQNALARQVAGGLVQNAKASSQLVGAADTLSQSLSSHVDVSASLLDGLREENAAAGAARDALAATAGSLDQGARTFGTLIARLREAADAFAAGAQAIETQIGSAHERLTDSADGLLGHIERTGEHLTRTTAELAGHVERSGTGLSHTAGDLASQVALAADRLASTVDRLAGDLSQAGTGFGDGVRDFASETAAIRSSFDEVVRSLRELPAVTAGHPAEADSVAAALSAGTDEHQPRHHIWSRS